MGDFKWIKIDTDIFGNEKMLMLESMPNGGELMLIWFKLLCLAGKNNQSGSFTVGGRPYTDELFAIVFRQPVEVVKEALKLFSELGMIVRDGDVVSIKNWKNYQSIDQMEMVREQSKEKAAKYRENQKIELIREQTKDRVAKHREKQKIEQKKQSEAKDKREDVTQDVTQCNAECNAECNAMCNAECNAFEETIEENREEKNRIEENRVDKIRVEESTYVSEMPLAQSLPDVHPSIRPSDRPDDTTENEEDLKPVSGRGRDVVYLSDGQIEELSSRLGDELYRAYLDRLSSFIIERRARIKNHYETILRWYDEDKRNGTLPIVDSVYNGAMTEREERKSESAYPRHSYGYSGEKKEKPRYGSFDYTEAFQRALQRSFINCEYDDEDS